MLATEPEREYWGFEPQIEAAAVVRQIISDHEAANPHLVPVALSDRRGAVKIHRNRPADRSASIVPTPAHRYHRSETFGSRRGDHVVAEIGIGTVSVLKMNVEGAELQVLRGLATTIAAHRPSILFEVLPNWLFTTGERLDGTISDYRRERLQHIEVFLTGQGYVLYRLADVEGAVGAFRRIESLDPEQSDRHRLQLPRPARRIVHGDRAGAPRRRTPRRLMIAADPHPPPRRCRSAAHIG